MPEQATLDLFWDLERKGKRLTEEIAEIAPKLFDFKHLTERAYKLPDFQKYPRKQVIIELQQKLIKEINNLQAKAL